jgi:acetylornithine deacetylase/succinyl-diaminopimelate desuccinylase-like protein
MPGIADNALVKAAGLVGRLGVHRPERRVLPETHAFFTALFGRVPEPDELATLAEELDEPLAGLVEPMLGLSVSPTMIEASRKRNVIPGTCEVVCDCRLLPGQSQAEADAELRAWLGEGDYELEWLEGVGGTRSSSATPLFEAIAGWVAREEPGASVVPVILPGFTDSHFLREAFGTIAYGFFPLHTMSSTLASRLVHSADERIEVTDLELGTRFVYDLARAVGEA